MTPSVPCCFALLVLVAFDICVAQDINEDMMEKRRRKPRAVMIVFRHEGSASRDYPLGEQNRILHAGERLSLIARELDGRPTPLWVTGEHWNDGWDFRNHEGGYLVKFGESSDVSESFRRANQSKSLQYDVTGKSMDIVLSGIAESVTPTNCLTPNGRSIPPRPANRTAATPSEL